MIYSEASGLWHVSQCLFAVSLGVIGRLYSVIMALPGYILFYFTLFLSKCFGEI